MVEENVGAQDTVSIDMENILTGRTGHIYHSETNTIHQQVKEFVERLLSSTEYFDDFITDEAIAERIVSECRTAKTTGFSGSYYRGRAMNQSSAPPAEKLLSPPEHIDSTGRYNRADESVLYISRTERTAHIESTPRDSETVWLLKFDIEQPELTYLNLDTDFKEEHPHLHHLLLLSEILPKETDEVEAYRPTQFLRYICTHNQISAIEFPSIRAKYNNNPEAVNMAVFEDSIIPIENQVAGNPYKSPFND